MQPNVQFDRLHSLDAVRGFALLAGVVLHATLSFLPGFDLLLPIADRSTSTTLAVAFFMIHMFRMSLFFFVAGFFARLLVERDGVRAFLRHRALRILLPLVVFWLPLFVGITAAIVWGWYKKHGWEAEPPQPPVAPDAVLPFPLTHLWFLYVLWWLCVGTALVRWLAGKLGSSAGAVAARIDRVVAFAVRGGFAGLVLAAPLVACLAADPAWVAWFGIPTPDQSLIPPLASTVAFTTSYLFGWWIHRQPALLAVWGRQAFVQLALAVGSTVGCLWITGADPLYRPIEDSTARYAFVVLYATGVWSWSFAVLGLAMRFFSAHSPVRRYIADSSYWVYLWHMPLIFFLQVAVQDLAWPWSVKFAVVLLGTLAPLYASYHVMVRRTWIGRWLNGRRYPSTSGIPPQASGGA